MKAIQKPSAAPGFCLIDVPKPVPKPTDVLIRVHTASICGTDLHITQWDDWSASRIKPPLIYGHEFCGIVEALGEDVPETVPFKPGSLVSAEMHLACGACRLCKTGQAHICEHVEIFGIDQPGCFAEYIALPWQQVIHLPEGISPSVGACLDSLGNAVHAVSKGNVSGKSVYVVGCGPIGLFCIRVAFALGASQVFASDISPYRLAMARQAGANLVIDAAQKATSAAEEILAYTQGRGVEVVLEMSGNAAALNDSFLALQASGTVVLLGIPKSNVTLNLSRDVIFKEAKVLGVNGREMFGTWMTMLDLLSSRKLDIDFIMTHRMRLEDFGEAIQLLSEGNSGKILLALADPG